MVQGKDASDDELGEAKSKRPSTDTAPKRPSLEEALRDIQAATDNNINPMYQPPATLPKIVSESNLTATEDKDTDTPAKQKGFSADASAAGASMVLTEDKARGGVGWAVYREFSWYAGHIFTVLVAVLVLGGNGLQLTQVRKRAKRLGFFWDRSHSCHAISRMCGLLLLCCLLTQEVSPRSGGLWALGQPNSLR